MAKAKAPEAVDTAAFLKAKGLPEKTITVRDLKKILNENCKDDDIVVLSQDGEGNGFGVACGISLDAHFIHERYGRGEMADDDSGVRCFVLWPA